jgi:hypothetical protein
LAVADVSASETKKVKVADAVVASLGDIPDGSIAGAKLAANSITADQIGPDAVGASELADGAVDAAAVQTEVIAGSARPTPHSHILSLSIGTGDIADDQITARLLADNAIQADHIADGQVSGSAGALANRHIEAKSINAADLADGAIGGTQLANNSVGASHIQASQVSGSAGGGKDHIVDASIGTADLADASVTNAKLASGLDGAKLNDGTITNAKLANGVAISKLEPTTAAGQFLAGPTTGGGAVTARVINSADLPTATATEQGAVRVDGEGLKLSGAKIEIDNTVTPSNGAHLVTYSDKGLVTSGRAIQAADLPIASSTTIGAVKPGSGLDVGVDGALTHTNSVTAGQAAKVAFDSTGHITAGLALDEADIPGLNASKITSGTLNAAVIADRSITQQKLADYSIACIQDTIPDSANIYHNGMLWLNPLAQQIRMWDGNVWVPIGVGALSEQNLRFCGLFDAATGKITVLTQFGRDAGYKVGDVLPTATDQLTGSYFVVDVAGGGTSVTPGVTYDAGDWCLCLGAAQGWSRIDTLSGGGGGGASTLDGLVDVDAPSPATGQFLRFDGSVWKPVAIPSASDAVQGLIELATQAEVNAGADTVRAVTPATLKTYVATASPSPVDATTTTKGITQYATAADVTAGTTTKTVTADLLKTTNDVVTNAVNDITAIQGDVTALQGKTVDATESVKGIVELATAAETTTGTDATRAVHPAGLKVELDKKAPLANPALTGTPTAPTAAAGTNTTQIATTAFVTAATPDATTTVKGLVQLADAAAITAGTAGRVVDAAQLKAAGGGIPTKIEQGNTKAEVTDTGTDGAFVVTTEGTERARVDNDGRLLVGTSSSTNQAGIQGLTQVEATSTNEAAIKVKNNSNDIFPASIALSKSRGTTIGSNTAVQNGDQVGSILFYAADGTDTASWCAEISAAIDGTPGSNNVPGRIVFSTALNGASQPTERLRITSTGQVRLAGAGITFNGDTATANELDDYEEGTWAVDVYGQTTAGTCTYATRTARYVKIGKLVTVTTHVVYSGHTGTGGLALSLPFACGMDRASTTNFAIKSHTFAGSYIQGQSRSGRNYINFYRISNNGTIWDDLAFPAAGELCCTMTYEVA